MGKNKLRKFSEMATMDRVLQYPFGVLQQQGGFPWKGRWAEFFGNDHPITLELGCGKGEYAVGLARRFPERNFIGIDIKGARMYTGAKQARDEGLTNVAFVRTNIELIEHFFAHGEVAEIWITFPDPQMRKERKRLTGTRFLELYRRLLTPGGRIRLKTDSPFLYTYTSLVTAHNHLPVEASTDDLYSAPESTDLPEALRSIRTFYEQQWLDRGLSIKYIAFGIDGTEPLSEPDAEIPFDTYRSFSRGQL
jgi:tRNA (guanine-N7-)-methyltransferase